MSAGEKAFDQSRAAAERVERLPKQLADAERSQQAWSKGAEGEAKVAARLKALEATGWTALHDLHWPGRPKANIDHVLIGPGGVLVIDSKNWSGHVSVRSGTLFQNGYRRTHETNGVVQQAADICALVAPELRKHVRGALCMLQQPNMQEQTNDGASVLGVAQLLAVIAALPPVLDSGTVKRTAAQLRGQLTAASSPSLLTTGTLHNLRSYPATKSRGQGYQSKYPRPNYNARGIQRSRTRSSYRRRGANVAGREFFRVVLIVGGMFLLSQFFVHYASMLG